MKTKEIQDYGIYSIMKNDKRIGTTCYSILGKNRYYDKNYNIQYSMPEDVIILDTARSRDITYILCRYITKKEGFYFHFSKDHDDIISLIVNDDREKIMEVVAESKRDLYYEYTLYINMMLKEFNHPLWEKGLFDLSLEGVTNELPQDFIDAIGKQIVQRNLGLKGTATKRIEDFFNIKLTFGINTCQVILKDLVFGIKLN